MASNRNVLSSKLKDMGSLTRQQRNDICYAVGQLETGRYLIDQRTTEQLKAINTLIDAKNAVELRKATNEQIDIVDYAHACEDPWQMADYINRHPGDLDKDELECMSGYEHLLKS